MIYANRKINIDNINMVSQSQANYNVNISLHIFILFTFLTIFYFLFASKLAANTINNQMGKVVNEEVENILNQTDKWSEKLNIEINWKEVKIITDKISEESKDDRREILNKNKNLRILGIMTISGLFVVTLMMYLYFKFVKKYDINLRGIIRENLIIFSIIGVMEFLFFTKIVSNYIPVTPDFVAINILDRIKYHITKSVKNV